MLFPTYDAPKYKYGYQILILFGGLAVVGMYLLDFLYKRDLLVRILGNETVREALTFK